MDKYIYGIKCWDKFPDVTVSIETITPDVAIAMLERNTENRKLKRIERLVDAISVGDWKFNGATIVFDKDGVLVDGQHRLQACVKANIPITTMVVRGVDHAAQITMDAGYKRNAADFLKMRGYKDCNNLASISSSLYKKDKQGIKSACCSGSGILPPTAMQTVEFFEANYETRIKPIFQKCLYVRSMFKGVPIAVIAPLFDEFRSVSAENFEHFYGMLTGKYQPTRTIWKFVSKLNENAQKATKLPNEYIAAYFVKAWNSYIDGTEIEKFQYRPGGMYPEQFPTISHGIDNDESERDAA